MPAQLFESALADIFARCEQALHAGLSQAKARAENLQAEDTSRLAFILRETIEHAVSPAIEEAIASYDEALSQPVTSNPYWEEVIRTRVVTAVEHGVAEALALDQLVHPWKPLLKAEAPELRDRLLGKANSAFTQVHARHGPRRRRTQVRREWGLRAALLFLGLVLGALIRSAIGSI